MLGQDLRFIYFDLDDTLLDHRQAERAALADLCRAYEAQLGHCPVEDVQATYHEHNTPLWEQYALGQIEKEDLKRLRFEQLLETLAVEDLEAHALSDYYMQRYAEHWAFIDGARTTFLQLAQRFPVGLLTNGFLETQRAKLNQFPALRDCLRVLVISEEVGVMKPHPEIFAHATRAAGVPPETILYVGNSYRSDVRGGLNAGWQVAWYARAVPEDEVPQEAAGRVFRFRQWDALLAALSEAGAGARLKREKPPGGGLASEGA